MEFDNEFVNKFKVSAIINTYNRYDTLIKAIESVAKQTYPNIEIIVVNDRSSQKQYYETERSPNVKWIDLPKSSREVYNFPSLGYTRNAGIKNATGEYIAFLDDDDVWMPGKIWKQLSRMITEGCAMSCTEGYMGDGAYDDSKKYPLYYLEYYQRFCKQFFINHYQSWPGQLPEIFDLALIEKHNFIIHSSVLLNKEVFSKSGLYNETIKLGGDKNNFEDWELWRRVLQYTNCIYLNEPLVYYDGRLKQNRWPNKLENKIKKFWKDLSGES